MALAKSEKHPLNTTEPAFTGYWAFSNTNIAWTKRVAAVTLGLYYSSVDYDADPDGNILRQYPETFIMAGQHFVDIFLSGISDQDKVVAIFNFIKSYPNADGEPSYFADAEIVP